MIIENDFLSSLKQIELALRPTRHSRKVGIHDLAYRGRSLEFAGYQEYRPGDDIKDMDWKLFARTDRYYIKQHDTHTPATALIFADNSPSMGFQSEAASVSKYRAALLLTFALGYVLHKQGDAFSFQSLFTDSIPLKPRSSKKGFRHLVQQLTTLDQQGPQGNPELFGIQRRPDSVDHIFVISDFLVEEEQWQHWIRQTRLLARKTTFYRLIDPQELSPHPHKEVLNLEQQEQHRFLSSKDWEIYRRNFQNHESRLRRICLEQNIHYEALITDQPMSVVIRKLLSTHKSK